MRLIGIIAFLSSTLACGSLFLACDSSADDPSEEDGSPSGGGASNEEIAACKDSCDQLKFFDCNDSVDQAGCYQDCTGASSSQIELFVACVKNDICDPTCSTHIQPQGPGSSSGSSDSSASCTSDGCGTTNPPPPDGCAEACETLQFFSCISAETFESCVGLCMTADAGKKDTFTSCVESAGATQCQAVDCYYQFDPNAVPGPTPQQIADCKQSCSDLAFFDCISGSEAAACASACDTATKAEIEAFLICTMDPTDCAAAGECL